MKYLESSLTFSQVCSLRYCLQMQVWILNLAFPYPIRFLAVAAGGPWGSPSPSHSVLSCQGPVGPKETAAKPTAVSTAQLQWWRPWEAAARLVPWAVAANLGKV